MGKFARRAKHVKACRHPAYRNIILREVRTRLRLPAELDLLARYHTRGLHVDFSRITESYLNRMVRFAKAHCPYYRDRLRHLPGHVSSQSDAWRDTPTIDRRTLREHKRGLLSLPQDSGLYGHVTTGGSTGEPLSVPILGGHDAEHQEFLWRLHGYTDGDRILALDGTLVSWEDRETGIYWTRKGKNELPYGGVALSSHYLNNRSISEYVRFLFEYKPSFIRGYPSFIYTLAKQLRDQNLSLALKGVELTSEAVFPHQEEVIKEAFGPIFQQYGHAEAALFAYTVPSSARLYCAPSYGLVEVLNSDSTHVSPGQAGEVVVTGFHNQAMPLIRYRTGDFAVFGGRQDGLVMLDKLEGRTQDVIFGPDGTRHRLTALVFGRHLAAFSHIVKWQIEQRRVGEVTIRVVQTRTYSEQDEAEIRENFHILARIQCRFEYVDDISTTPRGKSKLLIQAVTE